MRSAQEIQEMQREPGALKIALAIRQAIHIESFAIILSHNLNYRILHVPTIIYLCERRDHTALIQSTIQA